MATIVRLNGSVFIIYFAPESFDWILPGEREKMVRVVQHLSAAELRKEFDAAEEGTRKRHLQTILLLAEGATIAQIARQVGFATRWVEELLARYNDRGPAALGDQRRSNGARPRLLTPDLLERLRRRLDTPPDDGGVWTSRKVAEIIALEIGRPSVAPQRGWDALRALGRAGRSDGEAPAAAPRGRR